MKNEVGREDRISKDTAIIVPDLPAIQTGSIPMLCMKVFALYIIIVFANLSTVVTAWKPRCCITLFSIEHLLR